MGRPSPIVVALCVVLPGLPGCGVARPEPPGKPAAPAKVEKLPGESDLTTITLTPVAVTRLGIATAAVERRDVPRRRTLGGEVVIPPGGAITVSAPVSGTLQVPDGGVPTPGTPVKAGQVVFTLVPLLSPEARATLATQRVEAQGQIAQAQTQLAQAQLLLDRAERLRRDNLGGAGAVEDARAQVAVAAAALTAATTRREALDKTIRGVEGGTLEAIPIAEEAEGMLRNVHASAGQKVAAGALLFDVVRLDPARVRVPVYVGDLPEIDEAQPAQVGGLADAPEASTRPAHRVAAPPSGDPLAATVDLYYDIANQDGALRPGQRVGVTLPLRGEREGLVVPRSAVLRDIDGGAWVYEVLGPEKYSRRRVRVDRVVGEVAVLTAGPTPGAQVVTDGAAELFGIEFGGNK